MLAIDTNVLVRLIARDDPVQTAAAQALLVRTPVYLSLGVLIETEWVLRGGFGWPRDRINAALASFVQVQGVTTERPAGIAWALTRHAGGADWADMLHIAAATECDGFATFDRALARHAGHSAPVPVEVVAQVE